MNSMEKEWAKMVEKGHEKIGELIERARKERDEKGYQITLGYDLRPELTQYLCELNLPDHEIRILLSTFSMLCNLLSPVKREAI